MPIKKLKSSLSTPQEDQTWQDMEVNYTPEDRQKTLDEIEHNILSHYDISNAQKQQIINLFSTKMWWDIIYKNLPNETNKPLSHVIYQDIVSTINKEVFHDLDNTYINYNNQ